MEEPVVAEEEPVVEEIAATYIEEPVVVEEAIVEEPIVEEPVVEERMSVEEFKSKAEKLKVLYDTGLLTEEEFKDQKQELMSHM